MRASRRALPGLRLVLGCLVAAACAGPSGPPHGPHHPPPEPPALDIPVADPGVAFRPPPSDTWSPGAPGAPAVWRAEGSSGSFTLLGSIHLGDARTARLGEHVEAAWSRADEVVLEIDLAEVGREEILALIARYGALEPPATLESRVSPRTWELLVDALERADQPVEPIQGLQPWLAALAVTGGSLMAAGLEPEQGVDQRLHARARGAGVGDADARPVVGLETLESQVQALASLPLPAQERLLLDALDPEKTVAPHGLVEAWRRGEVDAFEALLDPQSEAEALLYERLVYQRNREMTKRLDAMARDGKERFVVVGLLHLVGDRGIPALLAGRGYTVSRLDRGD